MQRSASLSLSASDESAARPVLNMMSVIGGRTLPYTTSPHRGYSCSGSDGPATAILYSCSGSGASSRSGDAGRDISATVDVAPTPWRMPLVALLLASSEAVLPPTNASSITCRSPKGTDHLPPQCRPHRGWRPTEARLPEVAVLTGGSLSTRARGALVTMHRRAPRVDLRILV